MKDKKTFELLVEQGLSLKKIGKELNCAQPTVRYWLNKFGLKTKNPRYGKNNKKDYSEGKYCPKCEKTKPIDEFYKRSNRDNWGGYCKQCSNDYHTERVRDVKIKMINYMGGLCVDCGLKLNDSHYSVFEFHHIDPETKDPKFNKIKFQKWDKIKKEIEKCDLLCANCHRIRHSKINNWGDSVTG